MKKVLACCMVGCLLLGCNDEQNQPIQSPAQTPQLAYSFPEELNTPDGLALAPDNTMLLSVNNAGNPAYPPRILRLTDQGYAVFATPPPHPDTKKASPFDIAYGPDGNVYYCDNQFNNDPDYKSRLDAHPNRERPANHHRAGCPGVPAVERAGLERQHAVCDRQSVGYGGPAQRQCGVHVHPR